MLDEAGSELLLDARLELCELLEVGVESESPEPPQALSVARVRKIPLYLCIGNFR